MRSGLIRAITGVFCAICFVLMMGCGGGKVKLFGKVTVGGKALEFGSVVVSDENGGDITIGQISSGEYEVLNVPSGKVKISITASSGPGGGGVAFNKDAGKDALNSPLKKNMAANRGAPQGKAPPDVIIPADYQDISKTPLTYDTAKGLKFDIEIP